MFRTNVILSASRDTKLACQVQFSLLSVRRSVDQNNIGFPLWPIALGQLLPNVGMPD